MSRAGLFIAAVVVSWLPATVRAGKWTRPQLIVLTAKVVARARLPVAREQLTWSAEALAGGVLVSARSVKIEDALNVWEHVFPVAAFVKGLGPIYARVPPALARRGEVLRLLLTPGPLRMRKVAYVGLRVHTRWLPRSGKAGGTPEELSLGELAFVHTTRYPVAAGRPPAGAPGQLDVRVRWERRRIGALARGIASGGDLVLIADRRCVVGAAPLAPPCNRYLSLSLTRDFKSAEASGCHGHVRLAPAAARVLDATSRRFAGEIALDCMVGDAPWRLRLSIPSSGSFRFRY